MLLDFDRTMTVLPEVPRYRLFPGFDAREPDVGWLREAAFGGADRLGLLLEALAALERDWGTELFVVSFAEKECIMRALQLVGGLSHFGDCGERIYGWQDDDII